MATITDYQNLCIHTITNKAWSLDECLENYARASIGGITIWRQTVRNQNLTSAGDKITQSGLKLASYCRGGFFPADSQENLQAAIDENLKTLDEAAELKAPLLVLVCGAQPGQSLEKSREQINRGLEAILPRAEDLGVKLAVEPLHPMYADDRSAINTLKQANDVCDKFSSEFLGVAVDVYHLWWDPDLEPEIKRCGKSGYLFAFHICDWITPTKDILNDRGLMGEGCIPLKKIRGWVNEAGFNGYSEVEIFSESWWNHDQEDYLSRIKEAYLEHC